MKTNKLDRENVEKTLNQIRPTLEYAYKEESYNRNILDAQKEGILTINSLIDQILSLVPEEGEVVAESEIDDKGHFIFKDGFDLRKHLGKKIIIREEK